MLPLQVAALVPQREIDCMIGENYENIQSRIMTQALRKIQYSLCNSKTLIIFINQVRISQNAHVNICHVFKLFAKLFVASLGEIRFKVGQRIWMY